MNFSCHAVIVLLSFVLGPQTAALKCYVCGVDGGGSCENFTVKNSHFQKDCGDEDKSCLFERLVDDNKFQSRSCASVSLSDCQVANAIEYCYCTEDLCNFLAPFGDNEEGDSPLEEVFEGSGQETRKPTLNNVTNHLTIIETLVPKSPCSNCQFSDLLLVITTLLLLVHLFIP